jgi:predicted transcriptional regulator
MSMLTERLQILISPAQRRRLETEARLRGRSVAAIVREAIDASLGVPTREERRAAFEAIAAMRGRYLTPQEIEEIIAEEREANVEL